jgi:hypothetical protein
VQRLHLKPDLLQRKRAGYQAAQVFDWLSALNKAIRPCPKFVTAVRLYAVTCQFRITTREQG